MFGIDDMLASTGLSLAGNIVQDAFSAKQASLQRDFQQNMFGSRYQMQMADMQRAGLNPILGASQGAPAGPSGAMAQSAVVDPVGAMQSFSAASLARAQARKANAEADSSEVQATIDKRRLLESKGAGALVETLPKEFIGPAGAIVSGAKDAGDVVSGVVKRVQDYLQGDSPGGSVVFPSTARQVERVGGAAVLPGGAVVQRGTPGQLNLLQLKRGAR